MAASFPRVTVLMFLEIVFSRMHSVNYMEQLNSVWFLKVTGFDTRNIKLWATMAASFPRLTVLIFLEILFSGMYLVDCIDIIRFDLVCEGNWYWYYKYLTDGERWQLRSPGLRCWYFLKYYFPVCICPIAWYNKIWSTLWRLLVLILQILTMENDGSFVPQAYGVDISWSSIFRNLFVDRLLDIIRFDLVCEDYWYWYYKYLTMENDGSFVPQGYGVDISWSIIFRCVFVRLLDIIRFDLVCEDNWYWYYKYLTMENDGSFVPQGYGVDISWSSIFRDLFGRSISW